MPLSSAQLQVISPLTSPTFPGRGHDAGSATQRRKQRPLLKMQATSLGRMIQLAVDQTQLFGLVDGLMLVGMDLKKPWFEHVWASGCFPSKSTSVDSDLGQEIRRRWKRIWATQGSPSNRKVIISPTGSGWIRDRDGIRCINLAPQAAMGHESLTPGRCPSAPGSTPRISPTRRSNQVVPKRMRLTTWWQISFLTRKPRRRAPALNNRNGSPR